jgi:mono/diheme cytochrome c family protein
MRATTRLICATGLVLLLAAACNSSTPAEPPSSASATPAMTPVQRGEYIVKTSACHDCHTPAKMGANGPEPDMSRMLSGHPETIKVSKPPSLENGWMAATTTTFTAWTGPWGISYAANLTPDPSGLSAWDEGMFIRAIREGKHMGTSRPILPPMPWPVYRNLTDDDLKAVFAYLKTIPPVKNHVPDPTEPDAVAKMK